MGAVWKADDRLNQSEVAVKQVRREITGDAPRLALAREFQTLSTLRHPHIISVLDYGFEEGNPFLVMPLLRDSTPLTAAALRHAGVPVESAVRQILQALIYLHRRGVIHCDLKLSNVMVGTDGQVRLIDFGIASESQTAGQGTFTMRYLAPELVSGGSVSPASDLYSVGVLAYQLLAGCHPFEGGDAFALVPRILYEEPDFAHIPGRWVPFLARLLAKTPEARYGSAREAVLALAEAHGMPAPAETADLRESFLQAARFVGRQPEMTALQRRLDSVHQGCGGVLLVGGESGVGKSRLVDEMRTAALCDGLRVTRGQAVMDGGLTYQIWRDVLPPLLLDAHVPSEMAAILRAVVPQIGALTAHTHTVNEPVDAAKRFPGALTTLLVGLQEPTLIILEDLQWAADSVDVLRDLTPLLAERPVLVVATYRSDEMAGLIDNLPGAESIVLGRLSAPALADLSRAILGPDGVSVDLLDDIARQTEGNAFFVVEVMRALAEDAGSLDQIRGAPAAPIMTGGMRHIMRRRLNRAPVWARPLLNTAAVAGRSLDLRVLDVLAGDDVRLEHWLAACADVALFDVVETGWRFAHDKIREALLAEIDDRELAAQNRRVAAALEAVYGEDPAYAGVTARHWAEASDPERASSAAQRSDIYHRRTSAHKAAQHMLRSVLARMDDSRDAAYSVPLYLALGERHVELGEFAEARRAYERGMAVAAEHGITRGLVRGPLGLAYIEWRTGDINAAFALFERVLETDDADVLSRARALNFMGSYYVASLDFARAEPFYREAEQLCLAADNNEGLLLTRGNLSYLYLMNGRAEAGVQAAQAARELAVQEGNGLAEASALVNLTLGLCYIGEFDEAERTIDMFDGLIERIGERFLSAYGLRTRAILSELRGDYAQACPLYLRAIDAFDAMDSPVEVIHTRVEMIHARCAMGDFDAARVQLMAMLDDARSIEDREASDVIVYAGALLAASLGQTGFAQAWLDALGNGAKVGGYYLAMVRRSIDALLAHDDPARRRKVAPPNGDILDAIRAAFDEDFPA